MRRHRLGRTDLTVSAVCLGTMTFGEQNTEAEGHAQLDRALAAGIDFIDTAELYAIPPRPETQGRTEEIIGTWMKARGNRDRVILASKVCGRSDATWFRDDGSRCRLTAAQVDEAVFKSLKRLQTDHIDLYQVHWPDRIVPAFGSIAAIWSNPPIRDDEIAIEVTLEALTRHVEAGRIRHIGLSNESPWGTMRWLRAAEIAGVEGPVTIQNAYNLINRTYETGLAEVTAREGIGLLAYSPLGQGYLTGKYLNGARPAGARTTLFDRGQRYEKVNAEAAIAAYVELAREIGVSPATLALAFVTARPFVTATIIGATTMAQLDEDLAAFDFTLTPEIAAKIDAIHLRFPNPAP
ncbi:MAG: aldo/keto reductase [Phyllobacteriaceae bacterium]|nr:aldo/keto reductase [Phyllobacteriaceae bacterium]